MKYKINLLSLRQSSWLDRTIYFFLNYLRYILVITQIVVIGVFFYKFKVDQAIVDLTEAVAQKKEIITVSQPLIQEAHDVNFKLQQAETITTNQDKTVSMVDYFLSVFPQDLTLNKLTINVGNLKTEGITQNVAALQVFYLRLKKDKRFSLIDITSIKKTDAGYDFSLNLNQFN